ncbi:hypothetical protein AAFM48_16090 [Burkholderia pseudomallei]
MAAQFRLVEFGRPHAAAREERRRVRVLSPVGVLIQLDHAHAAVHRVAKQVQHRIERRRGVVLPAVEPVAKRHPRERKAERALEPVEKSSSDRLRSPECVRLNFLPGAAGLRAMCAIAAVM